MMNIQRFNDPDVHIVISAWPVTTKDGEVNHGIAWYTKLLLTELAQRMGQRFVVLAEKEGDNNEINIYENGKILVLRVFDNSHPSLYPTILTWLAKFSEIKNVSIHSEFGVNAGLKHYALLLPFMAMIRLTGRHMTYFAHNVITDVTFLGSHLNIGTNPFVIDGVNFLIRLHTKILSILVDRIVVLDQALKKRLDPIVGARKTLFTPIPVIQKNLGISQKRAKKLLGIRASQKVIMTFGFISSYKGTDWIVRSFDEMPQPQTKNTVLIVAGGPAHSLKDRPYYQTFYQGIIDKTKQNSSIRVTGFVKESAIPLYFAAADLVVLPYRGLMGASGALTHALNFGKPVLFSEPMKELWKNEDIRAAAARAKLMQEVLLFPLSTEGMKQILATMKSPKQMHRLTRFSHLLTKERSIEKHLERAYNELYDPSYSYARAPFRPTLAMG